MAADALRPLRAGFGVLGRQQARRFVAVGIGLRRTVETDDAAIARSAGNERALGRAGHALAGPGGAEFVAAGERSLAAQARVAQRRRRQARRECTDPSGP